MARKSKQQPTKQRRGYTDDFKREAVQMMLDGHSAKAVAERLGLSSTGLLYRWKQEQVEQAGPIGDALEARVKKLEAELRRVERERDVLERALTIFGRGG